MSTIEGHNPSSSGSISKKRPRRTSEVWKHLDLLPDGKRATCKYCSKSLCATAKMGTSHLKRHIETCKKFQGDTSQTPFIGSEKEKYERELEDARVLLKMKTEQIAILEMELNKAKVNAVTKIRSVQEAEQQKTQMEQHQKEETANEQVEKVQEQLEAELAAVDSKEATSQIESIVEGNLNDNYVNVASLREYDRIVNMTFASENEAFHFFNEYAKIEGFSVRRSTTKKDKLQNTITFRQFYCSRQGLREKKYLEMPDRKRPAKPISRCDCPVKFCIKLDPKTSRWWVQNFINDHNHDLAAPDCGVQASPRIANPKPVVTKGALKKNKTKYERIKSAVESSRKNKCRHCGQRGHNRQTCKLLRQDYGAEPSPVFEPTVGRTEPSPQLELTVDISVIN